MLKPSSRANNQFHYIPHNDPHYDVRRDKRLLLGDSAKAGLTHFPPNADQIPYDYYQFVDPSNPVLTLLTSSGYNRSKINRTALNSDLDHMQDARDWRNIEATHYVYIDDVIDPNAFISVKTRTGLHYNNAAGSCEGFCYQMNVRISDCATSFTKEPFHGVHYDSPWNISTSATVVKGPLTSKWTGIKCIIFNQDMVNDKNPTLQIWVDWSANNAWKIYDSLVDSDAIGSAIAGSLGQNCGGSANQTGVWGGPAVHFEWNNITAFKFKWLSAREIDPYGIFSGEGSAAGGGVIKLPDPVPVPAAPIPAKDQFKLKMYLSSKKDAEYWFMPMTNTNTDIRFGGESPKTLFSGQNSDGSWKVKNQPSFRYGILTSAGFDETKITSLTPSSMASAGFMQSSKDFRNVEITGYFRINSYSTTASIPAAIRIVARGGKSTTSAATVGGKPASCEGTQYWLEAFLTGKTQLRKNLQFNNPSTAGNTSKTNGFAFQKGKWLGLKAFVYNTGANVYLGLYLDEKTTDITNPVNNWVKSIEYTDTGSWSTPTGTACGGTGSDIITWGGPIVSFQADSITDMDIALCSVREIDTTLDAPMEQPFLGDLGNLGDWSGWIPLGSDWGLR